NEDTKDNAISWKVGAEDELTASNMVFATVSRGFKGGGNYVDTPGVNTSYKPEFLTAYELGSRNRFFDDTVQLNGELFYWALQDQQIPHTGYDSLNQIALITSTAHRAHMEGVDVDGIWK